VIGVFDSGIGGLSVLAEIRSVLPQADVLYVADRGRAPYGPRSMGEVQAFSEEICSWLIGRGASTVVVACNTASAAALDHLRLRHPELPIVGMEPAVKPAVVATRSGVIAVFATQATFQGRLFESVVTRFAGDVTVLTAVCPEWVEAVEEGLVGGPDLESLVGERLDPAIDAGADTVVLGCTHFSFLQGTIRRLAGPGVRVIDAGPAVAIQTSRVARMTEGTGTVTLAASGDLDRFAVLAREIGGIISDEVIPFP
jgi:glutamate racemase